MLDVEALTVLAYKAGGAVLAIIIFAWTRHIILGKRSR